MISTVIRWAGPGTLVLWTLPHAFQWRERMTTSPLGLGLGHVQTQLLLELCMRIVFAFPFERRSLDIYCCASWSLEWGVTLS